MRAPGAASEQHDTIIRVIHHEIFDRLVDGAKVCSELRCRTGGKINAMQASTVPFADREKGRSARIKPCGDNGLLKVGDEHCLRSVRFLPINLKNAPGRFDHVDSETIGRRQGCNRRRMAAPMLPNRPIEQAA
jgi:hypothetical protein